MYLNKASDSCHVVSFLRKVESKQAVVDAISESLSMKSGVDVIVTEDNYDNK